MKKLFEQMSPKEKNAVDDFIKKISVAEGDNFRDTTFSKFDDELSDLLGQIKDKDDDVVVLAQIQKAFFDEAQYKVPFFKFKRDPTNKWIPTQDKNYMHFTKWFKEQKAAAIKCRDDEAECTRQIPDKEKAAERIKLLNTAYLGRLVAMFKDWKWKHRMAKWSGETKEELKTKWDTLKGDETRYANDARNHMLQQAVKLCCPTKLTKCAEDVDKPLAVVLSEILLQVHMGAGEYFKTKKYTSYKDILKKEPENNFSKVMEKWADLGCSKKEATTHNFTALDGTASGTCKSAESLTCLRESSFKDVALSAMAEIKKHQKKKHRKPSKKKIGRRLDTIINVKKPKKHPHVEVLQKALIKFYEGDKKKRGSYNDAYKDFDTKGADKYYGHRTRALLTRQLMSLKSAIKALAAPKKESRNEKIGDLLLEKFGYEVIKEQAPATPEQYKAYMDKIEAIIDKVNQNRVRVSDLEQAYKIISSVKFDDNGEITNIKELIAPVAAAAAQTGPRLQAKDAPELPAKTQTAIKKVITDLCDRSAMKKDPVTGQQVSAYDPAWCRCHPRNTLTATTGPNILFGQVREASWKLMDGTIKTGPIEEFFDQIRDLTMEENTIGIFGRFLPAHYLRLISKFADAQAVGGNVFCLMNLLRVIIDNLQKIERKPVIKRFSNNPKEVKALQLFIRELLKAARIFLKNLRSLDPEMVDAIDAGDTSAVVAAIKKKDAKNKGAKAAAVDADDEDDEEPNPNRCNKDEDCKKTKGEGSKCTRATDMPNSGWCMSKEELKKAAAYEARAEKPAPTGNELGSKKNPFKYPDKKSWQRYMRVNPKSKIYMLDTGILSLITVGHGGIVSSKRFRKRVPGGQKPQPAPAARASWSMAIAPALEAKSKTYEPVGDKILLGRLLEKSQPGATIMLAFQQAVVVEPKKECSHYDAWKKSVLFGAADVKKCVKLGVKEGKPDLYVDFVIKARPTSTEVELFKVGGQYKGKVLAGNKVNIQTNHDPMVLTKKALLAGLAGAPSICGVLICERSQMRASPTAAPVSLTKAFAAARAPTKKASKPVAPAAAPARASRTTRYKFNPNDLPADKRKTYNAEIGAVPADCQAQKAVSVMMCVAKSTSQIKMNYAPIAMAAKRAAAAPTKESKTPKQKRLEKVSDMVWKKLLDG